MPRASTNDDIIALRAEIAELTKSLAAVRSEIDETRAALAKREKNGNASHHSAADSIHEVADEIMNGALKLGGEAAGAAGGAAHVGAHWVDELVRKNPTPAVLTALGVGFVLGVMGRR